MYPLPRYRLMVRAFAGDSTMISFLAGTSAEAFLVTVFFMALPRLTFSEALTSVAAWSVASAFESVSFRVVALALAAVLPLAFFALLGFLEVALVFFVSVAMDFSSFLSKISRADFLVYFSGQGLYQTTNLQHGQGCVQLSG